ncbi:MAG TPA: hypothetical protein VJ717_17130 [Gemmatimonadaceae bacterium]|nr:hypothetical protein [Gemmatimonadaceae bacterium]
MNRVTGALGALAVLSISGALGAPRVAPRVTVAGPTEDTLASATPTFTVAADSIAANERPVVVSIEVSTRADFGQLTYFDRSIADTARFTPLRPLPHATPIYWRGRAATALGAVISSAIVGPRVSAPWVRLVAPNPLGGVTLLTRRPTFIWNAAQIANPPGPWRFDLAVENVATREILRYANISESQFLLPRTLEYNASYRWSVTARLATGDTATVRSQGSFVIADLSVPRATLLYQNFPNPFPSATSLATCIWFDLHRDSQVRLTIHDIRGNLVRTLIPSASASDRFIAGRYGRGLGGESGCDGAFAWDGTDNGGRVVPTGVYLVRLRTREFESYKRAVFRGR